MKFSLVLPLAALSSALVIPDEQVMSKVAIECHRPSNSIFHKLPTKEELVSKVEHTFSKAVCSTKNAIDQAFEVASETVDAATQKTQSSYFNTEAWLESSLGALDDDDGGHHGHHGDHGDHGKHPHHDHPHKPNMTVYQLIAESKYTTELAALINEYDDIVELLNGTTANFTVFAPTNHAFKKLVGHGPKPSKEELKKHLAYHVSGDFYPAGRVLVSQTIPTLYMEKGIGGKAQRLSTNIGFRGLTVNFYSRVVAVNIFGTNGVIHGIDSVLFPPPKAAEIISLLPGEFSTLELALVKTGLDKAINDTSNHAGGTIFAPSNFAFQKLGPRINGFLFSKYGRKYLTALLEYHVVANQTLYSDAYYKADSAEKQDIPKGYFHVDLPTLLKDRSLSIDVARYGRIISIKINGFSSVSIPNGIAKDGVIHVVSNVLIPPKQIAGGLQHWQGEDLSEEELKERLEPYVKDDDYSEL